MDEPQRWQDMDRTVAVLEEELGLRNVRRGQRDKGPRGRGEGEGYCRLKSRGFKESWRS
jgi:hypothetical protein